MISLKRHQYDAVFKMNNGCILCGGVGSGKSRTSLAYYCQTQGAELYEEECGECGTYVDIQNMEPKKDLYIITTARKRDTKDWESEMAPFLLSPNPDVCPWTGIKIVVDSWQNVSKYAEISDSFFIFDEQKVSGKGKWVKAFLEITKSNEWILLSATPGDTWIDYIPVFIANGFFKNRTEFNTNHVIFKPFSNYPQPIGYLGTRRLERLRDKILVDMDFKRKTVPHHDICEMKYDISLYKGIVRLRWDPFEDKPIENASEYCYALRKAVNSHESRAVSILEIMEKHPKVIVFYNFDYELKILQDLCELNEIDYSEWNGHRHQDIPENNERWMYLVQYTAGAEGWNCIKTDTIIFYSQNYSYKILTQSCGRIDRMNTPFTDLYYYHFMSKAPIDLAIRRALNNKKKFNEGRFFSK